MAIAAVLSFATKATAQAPNNALSVTVMPEIVVSAPKLKPKHKPKPKHVATRRSPPPTATAPAPAAPADGPTPAQAALNAKMTALDQARDNLLPKTGASTSTLTRNAIETLPQADNTPIDKVILQFPGVSYDSAVSNPEFHVRNEYANVQTRINGVVLPEGVSALGR